MAEPTSEQVDRTQQRRGRSTRVADAIRRNWALLLAVVLLGGSVAIVNLTGPDGGDLDTRPGQFAAVKDLDDDVLKGADTGFLTFPSGTVSIRLSGPRDRIVDGYLDDAVGYRAPDDGSLLALETRWPAEVPYSVARATTVSKPDPELELTVIADGRRYPVRAAPEADFDVSRHLRGAMAVTGRPRDVRIEAVLDGVRQSVRPATGEREPGRAAGLYLPDEGKESTDRISCAGQRLSAGYRLSSTGREPECEVTGSARTAYVDGLGWAAPGRTWLYVVLTVDRNLEVERGTGRDGQRYRSVTGDDDLVITFDGRRTVGSPRTNAGDRTGQYNAVAVAQVAQDPGPVTIGIASTSRRMLDISDRPDPAAPDSPDVSVTWTVRLP